MDLDCSKAIRPSLNGEWVPPEHFVERQLLTYWVFSADARTNSSICYESISSANEPQIGELDRMVMTANQEKRGVEA